jgi:hypothetical protein
VIYNFLALCMAYVGGPGAVVIKADGAIIEPSWGWGTCCLPPMAVDGFFLRRCAAAAAACCANLETGVPVRACLVVWVGGLAGASAAAHQQLHLRGRRCKQGTLQFVFMKPIMAAITLLLYAAGHYEDGDWSAEGG